MDIEQVILGVQIISLVGFVVAIFLPYRALIDSKDATIQNLSLQLNDRAERIRQLELQTPDALAKSLSERVRMMLDEVERLKRDKDLNAEEIEIKSVELRAVQENLGSLTDLLAEWSLVCPTCRAPLMTRTIYPIHGYSGGREVEADAEHIQYRCGFSTDGQGNETPCQADVKSRRVS